MWTSFSAHSPEAVWAEFRPHLIKRGASIGGGKDHSSGSLRGAYRTLKNNGGKTDLFWDDEETHFILVNQTDEIIDFVNKNLQWKKHLWY